MLVFTLNKVELKYRLPYLVLLLISTYFVYLNTSYYCNELFNLAMAVITLRLFNKRYFEIKQPWKYYLFLALILAFYIKANSETIFEKERYLLMLFAYYSFVCACLLLLRDPKKYDTSYFIVFNFAILVMGSITSTRNNMIFAIEVFLMCTITIYIAIQSHENRIKKFIFSRIFWYAFSILAVYLSVTLFNIYNNKIEGYFHRFSGYSSQNTKDTMSLSSMESIWGDQKEKNNVVLRAFSKNAPTLLKAVNYNRFKNNEWSNSIKTSDHKLNYLEYEKGIYTKIVSSDRPDFKKPDCEIVLSIFVSGQLYYTNETTWVKTKIPIFKIDSNGQIITNTGRSGYHLYYSKKNKFDSSNIEYNSLNEIEVSIEDKNFIVNLASKIVDQNDTNSTKVEKIHHYLIENHEYDLKPQIPNEGNRVIYFLKNKSKAHCQYFSSSAVFLLRAAGVPSRIASGYLCNRYNEFGNYWISKAIDSHAWVEYFDNGWKTFDPTQGARMTEETEQILNSYKGAYDFIDYKIGLFAYMIFSGEIKAFLETIWDHFVDFLLNNINYIYGLAFLTLTYILYAKFFIKRKIQNSKLLNYEPPPKHKKNITKDFEKLLEYLNRKNIQIENYDTLDSIVKKIQTSSINTNKKAKFVEIITSYKQIRFKP